MTSPEEILAYWLDELGPEGWYAGGAELDAAIRKRFEADWHRVRTGAMGLWLTYPSGALAYIILTDQFPRNMFRGEAASFATDRLALATAKTAIARGWDLTIDGQARQFFYMPLMHSENLCDQDRCVRLMATRMPDGGGHNLLHAKAHRDVIRRFGRFPFRNAALSRPTTAPEQSFMQNGGYAATVEALRAAA